MKHYTEMKEHVNKLVKITCDRCGRSAEVEDMIEWNNFHHMEFQGAYGSKIIGDLNKVQIDLCEGCLDWCLGAYWKKMREEPDRL